MTEKRNILVTGATGKQGRACIHALLHPPSPSEFEFECRVLALTRSTSGAAALRLLEAERDVADRIELVEGDLDKPDAIRKIFQDTEGGVWAVFAVLAYPGLGQDSSQEEKQGKMLADFALEFKVRAYIYSSAIPTCPTDTALDYSHMAKRRIEMHCEELGEKGLNWIILRPGFFMENFDGVLGSLAVTIMKQGLKEDTTLMLIASEDIGNIAAGVLRNPDPFIHKVLSATSEQVTITQIMDSYARATGKHMPTVPAVVGKLLLRINSAVQKIIKQIERSHEARSNGEYPAFTSEVELATSVCKMQTFYEWKLRDNSKPEAEKSAAATESGWNRLSLFKLFTGRS